MGGAVSAGEDNDELVDNLVEAEYVRNIQIERALRAVDRGDYYLPGMRNQAYRDTAWKSGNLHISAPCIYAEVLENLDLKPGLSFLNLGSGTGYFSTLVSLILGCTGVSHGIELYADVLEYANIQLERVLRSPAVDMMDFCEPKFVQGNCLQVDPLTTLGYDRIYVGAAVPPEYEDYIKSFIKVGGVIVMPCGDQLLKIVRKNNTEFETKNILPVSFASLIEPIRSSKSIDAIQLHPTVEPVRLQDLCRYTLRSILRNVISEQNPDLHIRSILEEKQQKMADGATDGTGDVDAQNEERRDEPFSPSRSRASRHRVRRIVIPVIETDSENEANVRGGPPGDASTDVPERDPSRSELGRRLRHRIIAIGTAGVSHDAEGRVRMNDLRWDRLLFDRSRDNDDADDTRNEDEDMDANNASLEKNISSTVEEVVEAVSSTPQDKADKNVATEPVEVSTDAEDHHSKEEGNLSSTDRFSSLERIDTPIDGSLSAKEHGENLTTSNEVDSTVGADAAKEGTDKVSELDGREDTDNDAVPVQPADVDKPSESNKISESHDVADTLMEDMEDGLPIDGFMDDDDDDDDDDCDENKPNEEDTVENVKEDGEDKAENDNINKRGRGLLPRRKGRCAAARRKVSAGEYKDLTDSDSSYDGPNIVWMNGPEPGSNRPDPEGSEDINVDEDDDDDLGPAAAKIRELFRNAASSSAKKDSSRSRRTKVTLTASNGDKFSALMREAIESLPIPPPLKVFIGYWQN